VPESEILTGDADEEMHVEGHPLYEAYIRMLAEEGKRAIKRGDFVVAETREELRRILREG
jgi:hypothetical protein